MVKYAIVLVPNSFMWWIMNSSDRLMVTAMVGVAANGIYAVAYKIPTLLSSVTQVFNQAWSYSAIREEGSSDEEKYNNDIYNRLVVIVCICAAGLMMVMKFFLRYYVGAEYYIAWKYTPVLIIGFIFQHWEHLLQQLIQCIKTAWVIWCLVRQAQWSILY